jgi:Tol biopolymer transport system component
MQEAGNSLFSPMLGKFTTTNGNTVFTVSAVIDPSTNHPVTGAFYSIILSPDGKKAAIDLYGGLDGDTDQMDIFVADSSGVGNPVEITNDAYEDIMPQFSPDGKKVVFASWRPIPGTRDERQWQIAIMNADGSGREQILPIPPGIVYQMAPTFSPNGKQIATQAIGDLNSGLPFQGILTEVDGTIR